MAPYSIKESTVCVLQYGYNLTLSIYGASTVSSDRVKESTDQAIRLVREETAQVMEGSHEPHHGDDL